MIVKLSFFEFKIFHQGMTKNNSRNLNYSICSETVNIIYKIRQFDSTRQKIDVSTNRPKSETITKLALMHFVRRFSLTNASGAVNSLQRIKEELKGPQEAINNLTMTRIIM